MAIYYAAVADCADRDARREPAPAGHRPARSPAKRPRPRGRPKPTPSRSRRRGRRECRPQRGSQGARVANADGRRPVPGDDADQQCWDNLPILNEWKRNIPDRDPVEVHRRLWDVELVCPGGGKYVWNEKYGTMESTVYGHPGEPKQGPPAPPVLSRFRNGRVRPDLREPGAPRPGHAQVTGRPMWLALPAFPRFSSFRSSASERTFWKLRFAEPEAERPEIGSQAWEPGTRLRRGCVACRHAAPPRVGMAAGTALVTITQRFASCEHATRFRKLFVGQSSTDRRVVGRHEVLALELVWSTITPFLCDSLNAFCHSGSASNAAQALACASLLGKATR